MKGGKKTTSVDPTPPTPPPPAAEGGGEKCGEADRHPSAPPLVDEPGEEERSQQQQQQQRKKKATTAAGVEKGAEEDGAPAAEEEAEGDGEEEGEKGNEHLEELETEEGEEDGEADERPKLAEGFYEIEAVRRKRIRKGQAQYLIKWRGWLETANTWEPLENLLSCSDVIDSFEESLRSGKKSARRRKRKYGSTQSQTKKKPQQRSPAAATYNVPAVKVRIVEKPLPFPRLNDTIVTNGEANIGGANVVETTEKVNENGVKVVYYRPGGTEEQNELNLKLSQLKVAAAANGDSVDKIALHSKEAQLFELGGLSNGSANGHANGFANGPVNGPANGLTDGPANGLQKVDGVEPVQSGYRTGSRRRKPDVVKRFKQEIPSGTTNDPQNVQAPNGACGLTANKGSQNAESGANDLRLNNKIETSKIICDFTEIVRPVGFTRSMINNIQDVSVTFVAKRADGKEVMVDNKFLKVHNPVMLINFYEQYLRYTPA